MQRKPIKRKTPARRTRKQRLGLRISRGLDLLLELEASQPKATSKSVFSLKDQSILKRIQDIHLGKESGRLTETDYRNLKTIATKHRIRLP